MAAPVVVPDASVLLKWVLPVAGEADRDRALVLRAAWLDEAVEVVVPTLWVFEVANVLGRHHAADAAARLDALLELRMPEAEASLYLPGIIGLMRDFQVTAYDAAYHALAAHHRGTMVTADRRYVTRAARAGHLCLLDTWRPPA